MEIFRHVDAAMGRIYHVVGNLVGISIGLFAVAISLDLVLRLFGLGNLPGMQEIIKYALYAGVFLAAPWVLRLAAHVRVDLVLSCLPAPALARVERALDLFGLVITAVIAWYGWQNLATAYASGASQPQQFDIPEWALLSFLVLGCVLLAIEFGFRFVRAGDPPEAAERSEGGF